MNIRRRCFAAILALVMIFSMAGTVSADENEDAFTYVQQMLNYYSHHQEDAATDINCLIYALSEVDTEQAQSWASIMEYWSYVNDGMTIHSGVLPEGLPQNNALCIVVLGYALADDGSMKKELIGRLETALASAQKYPNALIVCTGGGTAQYNKTATEAGQMSKWLISNGISKDRIIIEDQSRSTVGNAVNTCKILTQKYPQVTHLALVTSDYHLPRASLLFHAQATLTAMNDGLVPLCVAANAAYETGRSSSESFASQVNDLSQLTDIPLNGLPKPALSKLDSILVSGSAQCTVGSEPDLQVMAYYDTGLYRDVSRRVTYAGIDPDTAGMQDVTVTYEEGGIAVSSTVEIEILIPETQPPTQPATEMTAESAAQPSVTEPAAEEIPADTSNRWLILPAIAIALLVVAEILIIIRLIKLKKQEKAAKAAAAEEEAKLPDDDSPLEYV